MSTLENTKPVTPPANPETEEVFVLPVSLIQERLWALDRMNPGNPTWSVPVRFRLQGPLDPALLERAFNQIIQRHEVLRTTFTVVDGQPAQVIKTSLEIEVPVIDLRHFAKPERDAEVDRLSFNEARWRFDLAVGPLFRVTLLRVEDNEHVMLVTPHHSVIDYLSIGLISNELGALYEATSRNVDAVLSELTIQYGDYAVWQREQSESPAVQKELAYWKEQLKDLPLLDVPTDKPRQASPTFEATITSLLLPVTLTDAVREIGNRESATFFNTMLAALGVLMYQYTGQTDFGAATQVAGRNSVELESVIGPFINTVVLRLDLSGNPTFPQLLGRVQEVGLQSIANQNVRYEQVLKELRPRDYPSHHTLFRLNFICQRDPVKPQEFAGIKLTVIPSKSQGALYDLHVFLVLRNEGWRLACEYNTDLFEAGTITRLLADFKGLLENIVQDPNRPLSAFPVSEGASLARQKRPATTAPAHSSFGVAAASSTPRSLGAAAAAVAPAVAVPKVDNIPAASGATASESFGLPASVAQRRFFALEEIVPGNPALHMRACVRLTGEVSLAHLEDSLRLLVDRHESLRTTFQKEGEELIQIIHPSQSPSQSIDLPVTSLELVSAADREQKLWESIRAEASAPFDLAEGPLLRARLFRLAPEEHVLILTTHRGNGFFRASRSRRLGRGQTHLNLELLYQFARLKFFSIVVNLDLLLVDVAHGHIHASLVDGSRFLSLANHFVVRLANARDFELLHRICNLFLPLGAAVIGDCAQRLLRLSVLFTHEGLLHCHRFIEGGASGRELALISSQGAFGLLQLGGIGGGNVVAIGLNCGFHSGRQTAHRFLIFGLLFFQQRDVGLNHGDTLIHPRHLVVHVADILLENQLRVFRRRDEETNDRPPRQPLPHRLLLFRNAALSSMGGAASRICIARRNRIFGYKIADRLGDLLFFLLFLQPPTGKAFFFP